jgi:hypothetical protein
MSGHWLPEQARQAAATAGSATPAEHRSGAGVVSALTYLFFGFLCGAVFWHFIGFWSTFHDIVLRGPVRVAGVEHRVTQWGPNCTSLVLDRGNGVTRAEPCAATDSVLAEVIGYRRDRLPDRHAAPHQLAVDTSWTVVVKEPATAPAAAPVGTGEEGRPTITD